MIQNAEQKVRTRDEQVARYFGPEDTQALISIEHFKSELLESEARGASEQRRKDATEQNLIAWVNPDDVNPDNTWCNANGHNFRIVEHSNVQTSTATMPIFAKPVTLDRLQAVQNAAENVVIAFGMGWDMEGVIECLKDVLPVKDQLDEKDNKESV